MRLQNDLKEPAGFHSIGRFPQIRPLDWFTSKRSSQKRWAQKPGLVMLTCLRTSEKLYRRSHKTRARGDTLVIRGRGHSNMEHLFPFIWEERGMHEEGNLDRQRRLCYPH